MKIKVKLLVEHIHADVEYKAGDVIDVDASAANWLIQNGHAIAEQAARKPEPKPAVIEEN